MSERKNDVKYPFRKGLSLIISLLAAALIFGIILGCIDGLIDIVSNNIKFDHAKGHQALSLFQKTIFLFYSMTLSGIFYGLLGLIYGFILCLYFALWQCELDTSDLLILSSWMLFPFITLKTESLVFSGPLSAYSGHEILLLGIAIFLSVSFSTYLYKRSRSEKLSPSLNKTNFTPLVIRVIIVSILFWASASLLLKIFNQSGLWGRTAILFISLILSLIFYPLLKKVCADDKLEKVIYHWVFARKTIALLITFFIFVSCFGIYMENRQKNLSIYNPVLARESHQETNVILILIDTLRADHLSCYGYERSTSPNIDRMAEEGVLFENPVAPSSWTKPSTASLFTSLYPSMHGVIYGNSVLPRALTTLAEVLKEAGYLTAGFVANPQIKAIFDFDQGFDFYDDTIVEDKIYHVLFRGNDLEKKIIRRLFKLKWEWTDNNNAEMITRKIIPWLKENKDSRFFLYLHYIDPHEPYSPPDPFHDKYSNDEFKMTENQKNIALYDAEIAYTDENIGVLLQTLEQLNIANRTLVVLTSDHGEEFLEHGGTGHGQSLYEEQIRVPLIMRYPHVLPASRIIKERAKMIDIMPTILDLLGIGWDGHMEGASLLPLVRQDNIESHENYIFSETYLGYFQGKAITHNKWKYIFTEVSELRDINKLGPEELYDLDNDRGESRNLINQKPKIAKEFREKLLSFTRYAHERSISSTKVSIDKRTKEQLKALGYVGN